MHWLSLAQLLCELLWLILRSLFLRTLPQLPAVIGGVREVPLVIAAQQVNGIITSLMLRNCRMQSRFVFGSAYAVFLNFPFGDNYFICFSFPIAES